MDEVSTTPSGLRGRVTSRDGTRIAYERYGDGPAVVLVSGALGTAAGERALAGLLARRFSVVAYDRRGRGGSGDTGPYAVEREIEDLAAVVGRTGSGTALHGAGTGGALVLAAVAAGLSTGPVSVYEPSCSAEAAARWRQVAALPAEGRRAAAVELFLADPVVPAEPRPGVAELGHTLAYDLAVLGAGTAAERGLGRVHARVLVVDGGASPAGTRAAARALTEALPRARHRTLTGQTHEVAPHVLAPVLEEFLTEDRETVGVGVGQ
ncbi:MULTISPECIES: alpha/beta hydrolase [unclassified Streptomyces]|uniref:alpha/beta fold hydrolase n=1 Tax=unclassified Streptomyces TaxID=2593676 RepID=UPI0006FF6826|nr:MULTISPECIES: alpha/beta hydrolase [unclassified Streptomyces]KQX47457.1 hydrolase [Streptomyces sp. Root1304]KRA94765.1 hydrolase [Streptomyces sp. Root66D1]